jgi:hypothetical protein
MMPSNWLKAQDLEDEDLAVTISAIKQEEIGQGGQTEWKWVLYFQGLEKGLVLNKTNATTIGKLHGEYTDDWMGKRITLYPTEVDFQGQRVQAIRVKNKVPKAARDRPAKSRPDADEDDEAPF